MRPQFQNSRPRLEKIQDFKTQNHLKMRLRNWSQLLFRFWYCAKIFQDPRFLRNHSFRGVVGPGCIQYQNNFNSFHHAPSSETQGQSVGSGEKAARKFLLRAKEPLGTDSQRTISKNSSGRGLLIGHQKCFVLLCPIGEHISISSFRVFLHDGYCLDHGLSVVAYRWFSCNFGRHK